ncbi:MAG: DUF86 domain-containing protein [Alphaproteobacteria bacterium]|nr:DUF86 domain-containing protein [Alphaproteobacteria bacterium]
MTAASRRFALKDLLGFLLQAIERVKEDTDGQSKAQFLADSRAGRQVRDSVVLNLGTMGEAADDIRKQFPEFSARHPQIPLGQIWDMRCHLFHGYHSINYDVVWTTCRAAVPDLERQVRAALVDIDND